jgi:hypothetical protein
MRELLAPADPVDDDGGGFVSAVFLPEMASACEGLVGLAFGTGYAGLEDLGPASGTGSRSGQGLSIDVEIQCAQARASAPTLAAGDVISGSSCRSESGSRRQESGCRRDRIGPEDPP